MNKLKLVILAVVLLLFFAITAQASTAVYTVYLPSVQVSGQPCGNEYATRAECD